MTVARLILSSEFALGHLNILGYDVVKMVCTGLDEGFAIRRHWANYLDRISSYDWCAWGRESLFGRLRAAVWVSHDLLRTVATSRALGPNSELMLRCSHPPPQDYAAYGDGFR